MSQYQWPDNVRDRELMSFGTEPLIGLEDLPPSISRVESLKPSRLTVAEPLSGIGTFAEVERNLILRALEACESNKVHAAAMLKISRKKLREDQQVPARSVRRQKRG
jgi:DNA-binding NtrC family response regulator